jgi:argininosuccinate lyase
MTQQPAPKPWEHAKSGEGSGSDPLASRFVASLDYDRRLFKHDIAGSLAHARMLAQVRLISADELKAIEDGLDAIEREIEEQGGGWPGWRVELEDVHMCIEAALIEKAGDAGRKLHTGRSRNDQVATDLLLWISDAYRELDRKIRALQGAFVGLAERDGEWVMPSYTHLQRAQPIVVGGELLAWVAALERCAQRGGALELVSATQSPLGSGAIAGSSLPLDRRATAEALGFAGVSPSSIDATANRDAALDFVYGLAMLSMTLSRWAEQWIIYATTEFGFVRIDDKYTTGSSMMPQKQNPDMLELIRGRCGGLYGHLVALLTLCKGLTVGYNRDLQEDKRHVFAAYDTVSDCLEMAGRIVATARFNGPKIAEGLGRGFLDATSLADYLVTKGAAFRTAHQLVGKLVHQAQAGGLEQLSKLSLEAFNEVCAGVVTCEGDVYDWLGAANVVKRYRTEGNGGLSGFHEQLGLWKQRLGADQATEAG